jgi:hypothetical protein
MTVSGRELFQLCLAFERAWQKYNGYPHYYHIIIVPHDNGGGAVSCEWLLEKTGCVNIYTFKDADDLAEFFAYWIKVYEGEEA